MHSHSSVQWQRSRSRSRSAGSNRFPQCPRPPHSHESRAASALAVTRLLCLLRARRGDAAFKGSAFSVHERSAQFGGRAAPPFDPPRCQLQLRSRAPLSLLSSGPRQTSALPLASALLCSRAHRLSCAISAAVATSYLPPVALGGCSCSSSSCARLRLCEEPSSLRIRRHRFASLRFAIDSNYGAGHVGFMSTSICEL